MRPMRRLCAAISALAALAVSVANVSAGSLTIHTNTPQVNLPKVNLPKVNPSKVNVPKLNPKVITPTGSSEVLVGFEHGDTRNPYVIGNMNNGVAGNDYRPGGAGVSGGGATATKCKAC